MENSTAMNRRIFFLTRSTNEQALLGNYNSASQAYEVNLISSFAQYIDTLVINIGFDLEISEPDKIVKQIILGNRLCISYVNYGNISFLGIFRAINFIKNLAGDKETSILTTGYFPIEMVVLIALRSRSIGIYSIIFDTHLQGNSRMPHIKRWAANIYFESGYRLLELLSGIIVLNDLFLKNRKKKIRYLKTKIGGVSGGPRVVQEKMCTHLRLLFAGTLNYENGVNLILGFLEKNPKANVVIKIAGYGELKEKVSEKAREEFRLNFLGALTDEALSAEILRSDFLLCLRDPESPVCQYAFPSKLIRFMSSGIPVISNIFPGLGIEYHQHLLLIDDFSVEALNYLIENLKRVDYQHVGDSAKSFIDANHRWTDISLEILEFMFPFSQDFHRKVHS